jgi:hypothetical protein
MRRLLIVAAVALCLVPAAHAQRPEKAEAYFYAHDNKEKVFYVTEVQWIPWELKGSYFDGLAKEKGWDTKNISRYNGSLKYISKASKFFEDQDRRTYQTLLENNRKFGYSIVIIPMPEAISVPSKPASQGAVGMRTLRIAAIALLSVVSNADAQRPRQWVFEGVEVDEVVPCFNNVWTTRVGHTWIAKDAKYDGRHEELNAHVKGAFPRRFIRRQLVTEGEPVFIGLGESHGRCRDGSPTRSSYRFYFGKTRESVIEQATRDEGKYGNVWKKVVRWYTPGDMDTDLGDVGGSPDMTGWYHHDDDFGTPANPPRVSSPNETPRRDRAPSPSPAPATRTDAPEKSGRNVCKPGQYDPNAINECILPGVKAKPMGQPDAVLPAPAANNGQSASFATLMREARQAYDGDAFASARVLAQRARGAAQNDTERVRAMQMLVAALYPDAPSFQNKSAALAVTRELLTLGIDRVPEDLSWAGIRVLFTEAKTNR